MDHPDMWFLTCVPNFSSLACLEVPQEPPRPRSHAWRMGKVPDWSLGRWSHPWRHGSSWYVIVDLCTENQLSSMFRSASRTPPVLEVILGGRWRFLTGVLEDGVIFNVIFHLERPQWSYPESFMEIWPHLALKLNATNKGGGQRPVQALIPLIPSRIKGLSTQ